MPTLAKQKPTHGTSLPPSPQERLGIWEKVRGMWKNKRPDPITELKRMRKEWDRKTP